MVRAVRTRGADGATLGSVPRLSVPVIALAALAAVVGGVAATTPVFRPPRALAATSETLYVSGLEIGKGRRALVRLRNVAASGGDVYSVHYTVRDPAGGVPISLPGAGDGARLAPGETLQLDLGPLVDAYRAERGLGPYEGPVQFVAFGTAGAIEAFGRETIVPEGIQSIGKATYEVAAEWVPE